MILSRLRHLPKSPSHFRLLSNISSKSPSYPHSAVRNHHQQQDRLLFRFFSTSNNNGNNNDNEPGSFNLEVENSWLSQSTAVEEDGYQPWSLAEKEGEKNISDVFDIGEESIGVAAAPSESEDIEEEQNLILLEKEEKELTAVIEVSRHRTLMNVFDKAPAVDKEKTRVENVVPIVTGHEREEDEAKFQLQKHRLRTLLDGLEKVSFVLDGLEKDINTLETQVDAVLYGEYKSWALALASILFCVLSIIHFCMKYK